jgi:hypothetical protein
VISFGPFDMGSQKPAESKTSPSLGIVEYMSAGILMTVPVSAYVFASGR